MAPEESTAAAATEKWACKLCGYIHEGPEPPAQCPACNASARMFEPYVGD